MIRPERWLIIDLIARRLVEKVGVVHHNGKAWRRSTYLLASVTLSSLLGALLLLRLPLLEQSLRDQDLVLGSDGTVSKS
jgi:hypothetical protein